MATSKEFLEYVLDKISTLEQITYRKMMGEYIVYCKGKIAAYLCDNRLLVKILPVTEKMLPGLVKKCAVENPLNKDKH